MARKQKVPRCAKCGKKVLIQSGIVMGEADAVLDVFQRRPTYCALCKECFCIQCAWIAAKASKQPGFICPLCSAEVPEYCPPPEQQRGETTDHSGTPHRRFIVRVCLAAIYVLGIIMMIRYEQDAATAYNEAEKAEPQRSPEEAASQYREIIVRYPWSFASRRADVKIVGLPIEFDNKGLLTKTVPVWQKVINEQLDPLEVDQLALLAWPVGTAVLLLSFLARVRSRFTVAACCLVLGLCSAFVSLLLYVQNDVIENQGLETIAESQQVILSDKSLTFYSGWCVLVIAAMSTLTRTRKDVQRAEGDFHRRLERLSVFKKTCEKDGGRETGKRYSEARALPAQDLSELRGGVGKEPPAGSLRSTLVVGLCHSEAQRGDVITVVEEFIDAHPDRISEKPEVAFDRDGSVVTIALITRDAEEAGALNEELRQRATARGLE